MQPVRWPDLAMLNPADMLLDYDATVDSLGVAFGGIVQPASIDPIDGKAGRYVSLRIDLDSEEDVIGVEIENVRLALARHADWRSVADAASSQLGWHRGDPRAWPALIAFVAEIARLSGDDAIASQITTKK